MRLASWASFKSQVDSKKLQIQCEEKDGGYSLHAADGAICFHYFLTKDGSADQTDFESNYLPSVNKSANKASAPFAEKMINGKKLFSRAHGVSQALSVGSNIIDFSVPYNEVKFNELEIVGCELGDRVSLKILDDASGTYTTVPNYMLNQFGFNVATPKDFYKRGSNYDADLFLNMRIYIEYESASAKTVYINYILHELKP